MGRPLPGIEVAIVRRIGEHQVIEVKEPNVDGELALKPGWPSMFCGYWHDEERYQQCFVDGWYITGDLARRDADGYFWFSGRADDMIKTAGHRVDPLEVERVLMDHPAVAEVGVIGKPEPMIGELVKAFVALKPGFMPSAKLRLELLGFGRQWLGSAVAPKEIEFIEVLPRTSSGQIMRRLLKARAMGLPLDDTSTA
jgi:acetyl-CoA synthetase